MPIVRSCAGLGLSAQLWGPLGRQCALSGNQTQQVEYLSRDLSRTGFKKLKLGATLRR